MSQNQRAGDGALFKNDKQGIEKRPDYTGTATIFDKKFYVSAWISTSRNGVKYMSLAFNENQSQNNAGAQSNSQAKQTAAQQAPAPSAADDDTIPF